jgi:aconitate hydratase
LSDLKEKVRGILPQEASAGSGSGSGKAARHAVRNGDVVLAAITSCTNTSNARLMLAAGILAKKAVQKGLKAAPHVKTSFTPGSRVVTSYLQAASLDQYLDTLGFNVAGYGCATCMGNSGPLDSEILDQINDSNLTVAAVLSGNRNFEARIHQAIKANFLMSPPLVVAFAIAGRADFDPANEALGVGSDGKEVYLADLWPTTEEMAQVLPFAQDPSHVLAIYAKSGARNDLWDALPAPKGDLFVWNDGSTYLKRPPFFDGVTIDIPSKGDIRGARALAILGDSVTTDHINPGGSIPPESESGKFLISLGVEPRDFNSYISRRAHDRVMVRSSFANVRIRNLMVDQVGSYTLHQPDGQRMSIFEAATRYADEGVPMVVFAGEEYGNGSSRDWAAKGPNLLGVRAVIARSFERIHRSNLVGMGILPLELPEGVSAQTLGLVGDETFDVMGDLDDVRTGQVFELVIHRRSGDTLNVPLRARIDSAIEEAYFKNGGILPYVLRQRLARHLADAGHA